MMRIALIDGSPRGKKSTSEFLIDKIKKSINRSLQSMQKSKGKSIQGAETEVTTYYLNGHAQESVLKDILNNDVLLFAFPNYFGAVPGHLLGELDRMEQLAKQQKRNCTVYTVVNCGFYYSEENKLSIELMHNWCDKMGFQWGQGLSLGAGGCYQIVDKIIVADLCLIPVKRALTSLGRQMLESEINEDRFVTILMPCKMYIFIAERTWYIMASKNGLKGKHALDTI